MQHMRPRIFDEGNSFPSKNDELRSLYLTFFRNESIEYDRDNKNIKSSESS